MPWATGCSYTKEMTGSCPFTPSPPGPSPLPPPPPSMPVDVSAIFTSNKSYSYNKGATI
jgi:hypothetical protein